MASLDKMEGDLIEGALLVGVVVLAVIFFGIWKGIGDPLQALAQAWRQFLGLFSNPFKTKLSDYAGGSGSASASAGGSGWSGSDEARYQSELLNAFNEGQMTLDQYQSFAAPVGGN